MFVKLFLLIKIYRCDGPKNEFYKFRIFYIYNFWSVIGFDTKIKEKIWTEQAHSDSKRNKLEKKFDFQVPFSLAENP
ncbi:hypothetical protein CH367_13175 [Leptospira barantonii]|uniref:Uncharacterized protein n=1 Tax=Leptospira barantonii TaxID=2023184 RepID=A0ABX4NJN5_9LEPT|nr:hypothetical protein CH367_13175 [Leptospira barantonii]